MEYKRVLTIAGSDSGGGAGVQADIKTISACGCYAASAITAITVQNTLGVEQVQGLPIEIVGGQIEAVLSDIGADSIKIGMLHSSAVIRCIAEKLRKYSDIRNVVLDPVMVSTSGHKLMEDSAIETLKEELIPLARIITPNIPEAEILTGRKISRQEELPQVAQELAEKHNVSVMLKAGHLTEDELTDILYDNEQKQVTRLTGKRLYTKNTHGTGCTLSSAIASMLAQGYDISEAVSRAKEYLSNALAKGAQYEIGHGHGPVCHFWKLWN